MNSQDVENSLLAFLRDQCNCDVNRDSDLLEGGYVDSLLVMDLLVLIKSQFEVTLQAADLAPRHFRSVRRLAELVASRNSTLMESTIGRPVLPRLSIQKMP